MADRDVTIRLRYDGSDFDRGVQQSADKMEALGQATRRAEQGILSGAITPEAAQAGIRSLSRTVNRAHAEATLDFLDPDRATRGGESALARADREAQRARVRIEDQQRRDFERTDPAFLAQQGIERRERSAAVRAQMEDLDPTLRAEREAREARWRNPLAGTAFARFGQTIFLAHTASSIAAGAARGIAETGDMPAGTSTGQAMGHVVERMAESIPIVGGLVRALSELNTALSGTAQAARGAAEFAETGGRMSSIAGRRRSIETAGGQEIGELGLRLGGLQASSAAAGWALDTFNANPGLYANPIAVAGVATGREGDLQSALLQAQTTGRAGEDVVWQRRRSLAEARDELAARQEAVLGTRRTLAGTTGRADEITARLAGMGWTEWGLGHAASAFGPMDATVTVLQKQQAQLRGQASVLGGQLGEQEGAVAEQGKLVKQELVKLEEAQTKSAKERAEIKSRELDLERNKLALLDQQIARGRGQEMQAGLMGPGQLEMMVQLAQQAKEQGFQSLPPEFRRQVVGFFGAPAEEQMRQEFRGGPDAQLLQRGRALFGDAGVQDVEAQRKAVEEGVKRGMLENNQQLQQALEGAFKGIFDPLVDAIKKIMEAEISKAAAKITQDLEAKQIPGRGR